MPIQRGGNMKEKRIICLQIIAFLVLLSYSLSNGTVANPKVAIQSTIDAVLETLRDKTLSLPANKEKRRNKIKELIRERFDYEEMAKRSLARHWRERTPQEKGEFVSVFRDLLETSYITKIESYTNEKITYDKEILNDDGKTGVVSTSIVTPNVNVPIDYKVISKDNAWWVYDVVIEGVSFISTYRSQYNKIITSESYASLIQKMRDKLNEETKKLEAKPVVKK